jgi:hypothetical protein
VGKLGADIDRLVTPTPTEVEVKFTRTGKGTRVHLEHRGFERIGPLGPDVADKFRGGWPGVMLSFANGLNDSS